MSDQPELLWRELERLRGAATDIREQLALVQRKLDERDDELRAARRETDEVNRDVQRLRAERDDHFARTRDLEAALERHREEAREVRDRLNKDRRDAQTAYENAVRRYQRLAGRRLVRAALWIAAWFKPLFDFVRRVRTAGRVPPSPAGDYRVGDVASPASSEKAGRVSGTPNRRGEGAEDATEWVADEFAATALTAATQRTLPPAPETGSDAPHVSAVILNRNGEDHLRRLLPALAKSAYPNLDVVVVDNASEDGSRDYLAACRNDTAGSEATGLELRVIANDDNRSFSHANNQGVAVTDSDYVLFCNNDVMPMEDTWLARLVHSAVDTGAGAVGARLVYPVRGEVRDQSDNVGDTLHGDLTLQHRGVHYVHTDDGIPLPRNVGSGGDPLSTVAVTRREVPAATAACLLVRRDALEHVGGFSEGYVYGTEDVDLCCKLRTAGFEIVYEGAAALWHREFATQNKEGGRFKGANRAANRRLFVDRWGPRIYRQVLVDRLTEMGDWSEEPLRLVRPGEPDLHLADAVVVRQPTSDIRDLPRHLPVVGVVGDTDRPGPTGDATPDNGSGVEKGGNTADPGALDTWLRTPWFDDLDIVLGGDQTARRRIRNTSSQVARPLADGPLAAGLRDGLAAWCRSPRVAILVSTPSWEAAEWWGDTHYGRALARQFERRGYPARLVLRDEFDAPWVSQADIVVHLLGLTTYRPRPGQINVLWNISHPELVDPAMCETYDLVFVASTTLAEQLDAVTDVDVTALSQATDPERFAPGMEGPDHELLFVANSRRTRRPVIDALVPTRFDLAVYGQDWSPELIDPRHVRDEVVANDRLAGYYANADVVLNDHWPEMREHGFISNRIYDVFAAGGLVVSDHVAGLDEEFDGAVVTFADRHDLNDTLARLLDDPEERGARAARGRRAVLARHTFAHRVDTLLAHIKQLGDAPPVVSQSPT